MPIFQSLSVVGPGPDGDVIWQVDGSGAQDANGSIFSPFEQITWPLLAASVDNFIWTCVEGVWQLAGAVTKITVSGGTGANIMLEACSGVVAVGSGVDQLTAVIDLEETGPNRQFGTLIATPTKMYRGDSLAVDFSGTLTGLVGSLTVLLKRVE